MEHLKLADLSLLSTTIPKMNTNLSVTVEDVHEELFDISYAEEKLVNLARHIFRGTWNVRNLCALEELGSFLASRADTWKSLKERQITTFAIVRKRIQTRSSLVTSQEDAKVIELTWIKWAILSRSAKMLVRFLSNTLQLLSNTPEGSNGLFLSWLSLGNMQHSLSGIMELLGQENQRQLMTNLKTFMETTSPGYPTPVLLGSMDTCQDVKELFWMNLTGAQSCPTYYVSWIDIPSRYQSRDLSSNGTLGSSGSPLNILLDGIMGTTPNGVLFAEELSTMDNASSIEREETDVNPWTSQMSSGVPQWMEDQLTSNGPTPIDSPASSDNSLPDVTINNIYFD